MPSENLAVVQPQDALPALLARAAASLTGATSSAEVLEARDLARVAYDAAKSAGRMARAKKAHDAVIAAVYRAQADAALIEARAKHRLADEYDAAQSRGEVATVGISPNVDGSNVSNVVTSADLGLRRDEIHEARKLRDAEAADPGVTARALDAIVARGDEPTKATLRREIISQEPEPEKEPEAPEAAKIRRACAALTREALVDDMVAAKMARIEDKATIKALKSQIEEMKQDLAAFRETDMGRALGNAQRQARAAEGRMREHQSTAVRLDRQLKIVTKERDELRAWKENQVVDL